MLAAAAPIPVRREWESRIPRSKFREAAERGITSRLLHFMEVLDNLAGVRDYDTSPNATVAHHLGKSIPTVQKLFQDAERAGLTHRMTVAGRVDIMTGRPTSTGRVATFLLWRPTAGLPVA